MGALAAGGMPTAVSVTVRMGLPPGPVPGNGGGPPPTCAATQAYKSAALTSAAPAATAGFIKDDAGIALSLWKLDLAAAAGGAGTCAHVRHDDARGGFATHLARLVDRLFQRDLHAVGKLLQRLGERHCVNFERERQHARGRQPLRLAGEKHMAGRIHRAVGGHRRQAPDAAGAAVGEDILAVKTLRIELDFRKIVLRCHGNFRVKRASALYTALARAPLVTPTPAGAGALRGRGGRL